MRLYHYEKGLAISMQFYIGGDDDKSYDKPTTTDQDTVL